MAWFSNVPHAVLNIICDVGAQRARAEANPACSPGQNKPTQQELKALAFCHQPLYSKQTALGITQGPIIVRTILGTTQGPHQQHQATDQ